MLILSQLKPHQNLKGLTISCYAGVAFPSWMGDSSYSNLEYLELRNCQRSCSLPSLGQLPSLKELIIRGMHEMERMGPEFYGDYFSSPIGSFLSLEKLKLEDCPKLTGKLPGLLPLVIKLEIIKCPRLTYSPVSLPSLQELYVQTCNEAVLKSMIDLTSLTTLRISGISKLPCLPKSLTQSMIVLEAMEIKECNEFTSLWEEGTSIEKLAHLGSIKIENCPVLVLLTREEQGLLPYNLRHLIFKKCQALETLPDEMMMLEGSNKNMLQLEELSIKDCSSLTSFPPGKLPTSLKSLTITNCIKLECLPEGLMNGGVPNLENLKIRGISLKNFPSGQLPSAVKSFSIDNCMELELLPMRMVQQCTTLENLNIFECIKVKSLALDCLQSLGNLTCLTISGCEGLESFPESGFFIPNLMFLIVSDCRNLKSLPNRMDNLTSLQTLFIQGCPNVVSVPEGGFPSKLMNLEIACQNLKQHMRGWGLKRLTSLERFSIDWICPPNDVLPMSLTSFRIANVNNLKSLSRGLLQNLNSLQSLYIEDCPKLRSLRKDGLPPSLGQLTIRNCPLLKRRCLEEKGDYWPLICNIPCVKIDETDPHFAFIDFWLLS